MVPVQGEQVMKVGWTLAALFALSCLCNAHPGAQWTYEGLTADADLVVIATPTESKDQEKTVIPNLQRAGADGKYGPIAAVGIETRFKVLVVLKGDKALKDFALYHLREAQSENVPNGPQLITFDLKRQRRYLLFLKRAADGRFISVTGQVDAAVGVKDLGFYP
jgi:hypothetical protein